jgi:hypothetical protein
MERDAAKLKNEHLREAALSYAQSLRDIAASARGKMTEEQRGAALERLAKVRERTIEAAYNRDARIRANLIFAQQINAAGTEGASTTLSKNASKAFWVANKGLWTDGANVPRNERYARILAHWYGDTSDARRLEEWLVSRERERLGRELTEQERARLLAESQGDLQTVYEYIKSTLDPELRNQPELDYERVKKSVYVAH